MSKPLHQVHSSTGISEDYWTAWARFGMLFCPYGEETLLSSLRTRPIPRYTEMFPISEWDVDIRNFRVGALDRLADEVNKLGADNKLDVRKFFYLAKCTYYFIHGCREHAADVQFTALEDALK